MSGAECPEDQYRNLPEVNKEEEQGEDSSLSTVLDTTLDGSDFYQEAEANESTEERIEKLKDQLELLDIKVDSLEDLNQDILKPKLQTISEELPIPGAEQAKSTPLELHETPTHAGITGVRRRIIPDGLFRNPDTYLKLINSPTRSPGGPQSRSSNNTPTNQAQTMAAPQTPTMVPTVDARRTAIINVDTKIDDLGEFPYELEQSDAYITHKAQKILQLKSLYDKYNNSADTITIAESIQPAATRSQEVAVRLQRMRNDLLVTFDAIINLRKEIDAIIKQQDKFKPLLELPIDGSTSKIDYKDVRDYLGTNGGSKASDGTKLKEIWRKLKDYAETNDWTHDSFKTALGVQLSGDMHEHYNDHKDLTLPELAKELAARFITDITYNQATAALEKFHRPTGEPIRQTMARLKNELSKCLLTEEPEERKIIQSHLLKAKIKELVSQETKKHLQRKEDAFAESGIKMTPDTLTEMAHTEESRSGMPTHDIYTSVSVNNITADVPSTIQQRFDDLQQMIGQQKSIETNHLEAQVDKLADLVQQIFVNNIAVSEDDEDASDIDAQVNVANTRQSRPTTRLTADARRGRSVKDLTRTASQENRTRRLGNRAQLNKGADLRMQNRAALMQDTAASTQQTAPVATTAPPRTPPTPRRSSTPNPTLRRYPSYERDMAATSNSQPTFDLRAKSPVSYYRDKSKILEGKLQQANQPEATEPRTQQATPRAVTPTPTTRKQHDFKPMHNFAQQPQQHAINVPESQKAIFNTYGQTSINVSGTLCQFCLSPHLHSLSECYALKQTLKEELIKMQNMDRSQQGN